MYICTWFIMERHLDLHVMENKLGGVDESDTETRMYHSQGSGGGSTSGSTHTGSTSNPRRRKKRPIHGVKTVSVTRGKSGYGFTISGQHPCVLSCIVAGSPADEAGLKMGDYVMAVNNENVSKAPHDDVVRMVGMSTGTLTLQVAENYNSSDSSDDEYRHRKVRYPNRVRTRPPGMGTSGKRNGEKVLGESNQRNRHASSASGKIREGHTHRGWHDAGTKSCGAFPKHHNHTPVGEENSAPNSLNESKSPQLTGPLSIQHRGVSTVASVQATPIINYPLSRQAIVKRTTQSAQAVRHQPAGSHDRLNRPLNTSLTASSISAILKTSVNNTVNSTANNAFIALDDEDEDDDGDEESLMEGNFQDVKVVVGYIGSIEIPSDANKPHIKIQSIRNAVRRLRVEQKIHTLVLMDVSGDGVKLTNIMGTTVAHYPVDRIAFSGISPDDRRFFGIVTLHSFGSDDASSENGSQEDEPASSGSCHVFMVDPEMRAHNIHAQKARAFKINCSQHADRPGCAEFPKSATSIILAITNLYKDRPNLEGQNEVALSQAFADPSRAVQRSTSNSSNSDSGLGFGREDPSNDNVFVDMPPPVGRPPRHVHQALGAGMGPGHPGRHSGEDAGRVHPPHCSPDNRTIPTPIKNSRIKGQGHHDQSARLDVSNTSTAEESAFVRFSASGKYNIRAMPSSNQRPADADGLDAQNSADSLRASINKYFRGRHMTGDQSHSGGSDQESLKGGHSSRSDYKPNSSSPTGPQEDNNYPRPMSTPPQEQANFAFYQDEFCKVVDMDEDRLSPRAMLPPPFHQLRSPSAPPVLENSFDAEDMETSANTSVMGGLIERFEQDNALRISSPAEASRRFSLSDAVHTKKREKEKTTVDDASERWAKPHSVRHRKISRMQPPLSHSHESLVAIEQEASNQRLISANSANNITNHGIDEDEKKDELDDIGRIAGWAVSFEKLLKDKNGLAVFTEFLKKEFSEENIVFWRICEQYKGILDADRRKTKAKEIFSKHISTKAADPVNIDHITRQAVEKQLDNPMSNTFEKPQLEIYRLMKQDSYQRFLKSDLYKKYMMREIEGKPLDLPKDEFQGILGSKELKEEKKKAAKNKETEDKEKRRRSLLPWRQRSSKQSLKATSDSDLKKSKDKNVVSVVSANAKEREVNNNTAAVAASLKKASGIDLSTIRKEVQANSKEQQSVSDSEEHFKFCRVTLPDGSTTVVCAKPGQDIRAVLGKLCEKRGLSIASVDVFLLGSDKPLDLSEDISTLGSQEVTIERRVLFRMDLPNKKSIGVKAKPNRSVRDVFKPILNKYGFKLDSIIVQLVGRQSDIDLDAQVSTIDNQRVVIKNQEDVTVNKTRKSATFKWQKIAVRHPRNFISMVTERTLDCDTQCIFDDILKGESQTPRNFDEFGILDMSRSQEQQKNSADRHSSGLFGHKKKEPQAEKQASQAKLKNKQKVTFNLQKNTSRRPPSYADDQFLDLLMKVSGRLDDQRGLDTQNCEIPDFLRNKPHPSGRESAPPIMVGGERSSLQRFMDSMSTSQEYVENDTGAFMAYTRHPLPNRPSSVSLDDMDHKQQSFTDRYTDFDHNVNHSDSFGTAQNSFNNSSQDFSFLMDGTTQSQEDNSDFFHSTLSESTDFDDPCLADKSETKDFSVNKYQSAKAWGYSRHRPYVQSPLNRSSTPDLDLTLTQSRTDLDGTVTNSPDTSSPFRSQSVPPVTDNGNVSLSPIGQNNPRFSQPSWQYSNGPSSSPRLHNSPKNLHHPGHSPSEAPRKFQNVQSVSMTTDEDRVLSNSSVRKYNVLKSSKAADRSLHIVSPRKNDPVVIDLDHPEENVTFV